MQRSWSMTRVADDYYRNLLPSAANTTATATATSAASLPVYTPSSKKDKTRFRLNAVHFIPLVLFLCAIILWFLSSSSVDVVNKTPGSAAATIEGLHVAGGHDIDGTQNNLMQHVELEGIGLLNRHRHQALHRN